MTEDFLYRNHPDRCPSNILGLTWIPIDPNAKKFYIPQKKKLSRRNKNRSRRETRRWNRDHKVKIEHGETTYRVRVNGFYQFHRIDGPARILADGTKLYYRFGRLSRPTREGPACERANGDVEYYWNGCLHRLGGEPAVIKANGNKDWYEKGRWIKSYFADSDDFMYIDQ